MHEDFEHCGPGELRSWRDDGFHLSVFEFSIAVMVCECQMLYSERGSGI